MLNYFRKNSKIILAILGVILMLSWLVVPALTDIMMANSGRADDPVVVTWKGGKLTRDEFAHLRVVHSAVVRFVEGIMRETVAREGVPRAPGYSQEFDVGISGDTSDFALLRTMLLAQRAKELGVRISDESVKNYLLDNVSDRTLKEGDLANLVQQAIPDSNSTVTQTAIFEHLKTQLLAQQMLLMFQGGIDSMRPGDLSPEPRSLPIGALPPGEMWEIYEKFNRQVQIEAYPLRVADYVSKVSKQPTEAELKKLFEEGRNREPNPLTSEPAFRQPFRSAFEYVNLDITPYLEAAKKDITEEQIVAEYEKGKATGRYKAEDPPPVTPEKKPEEGKKPEDNKPEDGKKPEDKKSEDKSDGTKPVDDTPAKAGTPTEKPDDKKPATETPPAPKKNEGSSLLKNAQFVNFQEDDKKKKEDKPADPKPGETKPAETKPAEAKPTETKPADPAAKPEAKPGDPATPEVKPGETKPAEPKEIKFKTLDEVREEIRTSLAQKPATDERNKLVTKIISAVNDYGRKYNRWKIYSDRAKEAKADAKGEEAPKEGQKGPEKPAPIDWAKVLGDAAVKVEKIPLVDPFEVSEQVDDPQPDGTVKKKPKYPLAAEAKISADAFRSGSFPRFPQFAFDRSMPLFSADTLPFPRDGNSPFMGGGGTNLWIYWRTDEQLPKEVDFADARKQVEAFWKQREALAIAKEAATKLAEQADKGKELKTIVPNSKDVITPPGFTWLSTGSVGGQFGNPMPSRIEGIELAGDDFRTALFNLQVGQAGTAVDQPKKTVWVVRIVSEEGNLTRERFLEKAQDFEFVVAALQTEMVLERDLFDDLIDSYDIKWTPAANRDDE